MSNDVQNAQEYLENLKKQNTGVLLKKIGSYMVNLKINVFNIM